MIKHAGVIKEFSISKAAAMLRLLTLIKISNLKSTIQLDTDQLFKTVASIPIQDKLISMILRLLLILGLLFHYSS